MFRNQTHLRVCVCVSSGSEVPLRDFGAAKAPRFNPPQFVLEEATQFPLTF